MVDGGRDETQRTSERGSPAMRLLLDEPEFIIGAVFLPGCLLLALLIRVCILLVAHEEPPPEPRLGLARALELGCELILGTGAEAAERGGALVNDALAGWLTPANASNPRRRGRICYRQARTQIRTCRQRSPV
ncbi:unnamed protein product [Lampetra fluviatilis]